jgi:hypothetical protein
MNETFSNGLIVSPLEKESWSLTEEWQTAIYRGSISDFITRIHSVSDPVLFTEMSCCAAGYGRIDIMVVLHGRNVPKSVRCFGCAALFGQKRMMFWLKTNDYPWDANVLKHAVYHGSPRNIRWLLTNGCDKNPDAYIPAVLKCDIVAMEVLFSARVRMRRSICSLAHTTNVAFLDWFISKRGIVSRLLRE